MDYTVFMSTEPTERWELAKQMGLSKAVSGLPRGADGDPWDFEALLELSNRFADAGLDLAVIEDRPPLDDAILGRDGRDEQIETVKTLLRNMGRVGIDVWCYVWMAPLKVLRTSRSVRGRGDSLVTRYDHEQMDRGPELQGASAEQLWANLEYFLDEVVPVAEEAGVKLALHPDDPPHSPVRGVERIITSPEAYRRVMDLHDSEYNGITLCQGNFAAMGADVPAAIREFDDRIHFAHFRDVEGTSDDFTEVWHDEGPTDMAAAIRAYEEIGFDGPLRPDHCPTMAGEDNASPGYHDKGRLFAVGYLKGLRDQYRSMDGG
ncbi:mannonate dehydratase [Halosimplex carlsbadense 2-9-1]|uniref:mannonate dehydratase n=1 Tax=Halosimplex carlsbadense 2-9-1 TaxID=797114 RepID=M0D1V9_9EURY|nr:mannonate dehydratase [Halosimplex carlsbadense]ELZ29430.1 mannonate dehydratase [Halosimplex carlsbadense 2-9-1]